MINMKRTIKKLTALILIVILALSVTACSNSGEKAKEIHIGYFNNVTRPQALLTKAEGTLEKSLGDDVSVKWTAFNAGPAEQEALFAGDIDIGYIGPVPAITANSKSNGDVQILSSATQGGAILVKRQGADIDSVEDNTLYLLEEEKDDIYLIPDGSIGEEKLDSELRRKLSYIDAAVEELASI